MLIFTVFMPLVAIVLLIRNNLVHQMRIWVLYRSGVDASACLAIYDTLPSYDNMLFNPRYYGVWTLNQWLNRLQIERK